MRVAMAVVAVLVLGWLVVMERDAYLLDRAVKASGRVHGPAAAARTEADFRRARVLNPDSTPDVGRAVVYFGTNRRAQAAAVLEDVLRREPDNLTAWGLLFTISRQGADPAAERRALAARRRLDPLSARPRPAP